MKNQLTLKEIENYISIGFCQPKFYKPSAWRQAKKIMDKLCSIPETGVIPFNYGYGKGKYSTIKGTDLQYSKLAEIYYNTLNLV